MKLGIVGLPNVGKSTLFNAITDAGAQSANYPFCTIEPNVGVVAVPDERLDKLVDLYKPKSVVPASIEFVDIAGLVKGASQGEVKNNDNDVCDMKEADFENNFMIVTAIENTSMVGLTLSDIYNNEDRLIIELNKFPEGEDFEEKHTAISIVIPRTMNKENILVNDMRNRASENPYGWTNTSIKGLEKITENQAIETAKQYAKDLTNSKSLAGQYLKDYTKVYSIELTKRKPNNYWLITEGIITRQLKQANYERDVYEVVLVSEYDELEIERAFFYVDAYANTVIAGDEKAD